MKSTNSKDSEDSGDPRDLKQSEALLYFANADRAIRKPADPMRRRQPKIIRHMSRNQRIASGQSADPIRAIYTEESRWNETPVINPEEHELTREVGPNDTFNSRVNYRTGKKTSSANGEGNKTTYRGRTGRTKKGKSLDELLKEYE